MWPYLTDEQFWLVPASEWANSAILSEVARRAAAEKQLAVQQIPLPMPAPYDDGNCDPETYLCK